MMLMVMVMLMQHGRVFNSGSPYNVQAGQTANLDALVAHYEKKNREAAAKFER